MTDREACVAFTLISGVGFARYRLLRERFGSAAAALRASEAALAALPNFPKALAALIASRTDNADVEDEMAYAEKAGARIVTIEDPDYPSQLKQIHDPPLCLYIRGEGEIAMDNALAIVGTRRLTAYGKRMAENLAAGLASMGWTIVSGLAYGVDAAAHQAVVNVNGRTVAVLGGGLARIAPQDHVPLARDIIRLGGMVLSEVPLRKPPVRQSYAIRNRIISGLSRGVIVVEAARDSGAMITANFALEQDRTVFAVPGRADDPQSTGCNELLRQGATLVRNVDDVLNEFEFLPGFAPVSGGAVGEEAPPSSFRPDDLDEDEKKIFAALSLEEKTPDRLMVELDLPMGRLLAKLSALELKKRVRQLPGKRFELVK